MTKRDLTADERRLAVEALLHFANHHRLCAAVFVGTTPIDASASPQLRALIDTVHRSMEVCLIRATNAERIAALLSDATLAVKMEPLS